MTFYINLLSFSGGAKQWKMMSILVAFPAIVVGMFNAFIDMSHEKPEFIAYEHLRIRNKVNLNSKM